ncbi:MAG: S8 family serine peptidase [Defluviitaleaceae bacterium]|nr:S8 family serine peptidase [Defluviitaleaceae bacterium]
MKNTIFRLFAHLLVFVMVFTSLNVTSLRMAAQEEINFEKLEYESEAINFLTSTLAEPVGMQGFEGEFALDNSSEIVEIVVQFSTPPSVVLQHLQERNLLQSDMIHGMSLNSTNETLEEQALVAHTTFYQNLQQLVTTPDTSEISAFSTPEVEIFGEYHKLFNGVYMRVPADMVSEISSFSGVFAVTPYVLHPLPDMSDIPTTPNISGFSTSPFFHNPNLMRSARNLFSLDYIHNDLGYTGNGVRVAIIDGNINHNHPEFVRQLDGTGRVPGWQYYDDSNVPPNHHGTLTAGSVIAMAPEVELWSFFRKDPTGGIEVMDALHLAHDLGMDVIYTWGREGINHPYSAFSYAITAIALDTVVVVTAHNFGPDPFTIYDGGNSSLAITVGSGLAGHDTAIWELHLWEHENQGEDMPPNRLDEIGDTSGRGPVAGTFHIKPDIIAPGHDAISTSACGGYALYGGTSMAGPITAGIAALLVQAFPNAEPWEIKARMMNNARPLADMPNESVFTVGAGFVQPLEAITSQAFATVQHGVPMRPNIFEPQNMASLSFGTATSRGSESPPMTITIHNSSQGTWIPQVFYNGEPNNVYLDVSPAGENKFSAFIMIPSWADFGLYDGNLIFTNSSNGRKITMPFAVNIMDFGADDITDSFTDPHFLEAVREITARPYPQPIYRQDVMSVTDLWIGDREIADLNGLEHFTALKKLIAWGNQLTSLDLSNNLNLDELRVQGNRMTSFDDIIGLQEIGFIQENDKFNFWPQRSAPPSNLTVTANNPSHGNAFAQGEWSPSNNSVAIEAKPENGYAFERWEVLSGSIQIRNIYSTRQTFSPNDITEPTHIQAVFIPLENYKTITLNVNNPEIGAIRSSQPIAQQGQLVDIWTNTLLHGAEIDGHTSNMDLGAVNWQWVSVSPDYWHTSFVMPNHDVEITAHFSGRYKVTVETNGGNEAAFVYDGATWEYSAYFAENSVVDLMAAKSNDFSHWEVVKGNIVLEYNRPHGDASFIMPREDVIVRAVYINEVKNPLAPTITEYDASSGIVNIAYGKGGVGFRFISSDEHAVWSIIGTLPQGLTFNSHTGIITGTPTQIGVFDDLTIRAENSHGYDEKTFSIVIESGGWKLRETPDQNILWRSIAYGNDMYVAFGAMSGQQRLYIMTSTDGDEWELLPPVVLSFTPIIERWTESLSGLPAVDYINVFVTYDKARGVFVGGASALGRTRLIYSQNGTDWNNAGNEITISNVSHSSIAANNDRVVVMGYTHTLEYNRPPVVLVSQDLTNWQTAYIPVEIRNEEATGSVQWRHITFGNGVFAATSRIWRGLVDNSIPSPTRTLVTSTDGINWTLGSALWGEGLSFGNGLFASTVNRSSIATSADMQSWTTTQGTAGVIALEHIKDGLFAMVGNAMSVAIAPQRNERIFLPVPEPFHLWNGIVSDGKGRVVAVASTGQQNQRAMTYDFRWINANSTVGGEASANKSTAVPGTAVTVTVTATPDNDYVFERWVSNVTLSETALSGYSLAEEYITATQQTDSVEYDTIYDGSSGGSVPFASNDIIFNGETNEIFEPLDYDNELIPLSDNDVFGASQSSATTVNQTLHFIMPNEDVNITAMFRHISAPAPVVVTTTAGQNGSLTATENGTSITAPAVVDTGATVVFTATPNEGYQVANWIITGGAFTGDISGNTRTAIINDDVSVRVTFEPIPSYSVIFNLVGGNINGNPNSVFVGNILHGTGATPPENPTRKGWVFDDWDIDFSNVTNNITVRAKWLRLGAVSTGGKGNVSSADVVWLARHIAGHAGFDSPDERVADMNGDGIVDAGDITALLRWLVGYDLDDLRI